MNPSMKLFVPGPEQSLDMTSRLSLIAREKTFSPIEFEQLDRFIKKPGENQAIKKELESLIASNDFSIDEVEVATLYAAKRLLAVDEMNDADLLKIDPIAKKYWIISGQSETEFIRNNHERLKDSRVRLKNVATDFYIRHDIPKIRAKVAAREVMASFSPDIFIPLLVELTPKYLQCEFCQNWLIEVTGRRRFSEGEEKDVAQYVLKRLSKAMIGDSRKDRTRIYPYWKLAFIYYELMGGIKLIRSLSSADANSYLKTFMVVRDIPSEFETRILDKSHGPSLVSLDIMVEQGHIKDPKAFLDIQAPISKLSEKHFGDKFLDDPHFSHPIVADLLDIPTTRPDVVFFSRFWEVLELVQ